MAASGRVPSKKQPVPKAQALLGDPETAASGDRVRRDHHQGVTGPVHTFVKTDKHAHFKWGVRHHVGHEYSG